MIDPVLDGNSVNGDIGTIAADNLLATVKQNKYVVNRILQTHEPTDRQSAAWYLRTKLLEETGHPPRMHLGKSMHGVQRMFRRKYGSASVKGWNIDFDAPLVGGETLRFGRATAFVLMPPSERTDQIAFVIGDNVFIPASDNGQEDFAKLLRERQGYRFYSSRDGLTSSSAAQDRSV